MQTKPINLESELSKFTCYKLYKDTGRVLGDTYRLLSLFPSLTSKEEGGEKKQLVNLAGTIPIVYKGIQYHLPFSMWIPTSYPNDPPTCYVIPTKDMIIKMDHKHVTPNGECHSPYLHAWNVSSNLLQLVTELVSLFSKSPPLYEKKSLQQGRATFISPQPPRKTSELEKGGSSIFAPEKKLHSESDSNITKEWKNTIESMLGPKTTTLLDVKISASRETIGVFVQVEGEAPRETAIQVIRAATLSHLRTLITAQLDDFEFEYKFLNPSGPRVAVISTKQESLLRIEDITDKNLNIFVRKI